MNLSRRDLLLGAGALGLAACGAKGSASSASPAGTTLKFAVVSSFVNNKVTLSGLDYVIEQQGWLRQELEKRQVKFEWFPAPNAAVGPIVNEAFANRQIQFAGYSDLPSIILNASGAPEKTRLVAPGAPSDGFLVVPPGSNAKSIEDLRGQRLAIHRGRPWELQLLRLLESKGLTYEDFKIFNINPEAGAAAVATGGVDGLFTISAYALEDKGVGKIIWSTADAPLSWKAWGGTWVAKSYLDKYPDIAQLVVTAYVKAAHWVSDEANKDLMVELGTRNGTPERIVRETYDRSGLTWKERWSPIFRPQIREHYRDAAKFALDNKIIATPLAGESLIDDRLVKVALKDLGLESYWADPAAPATL